MPKHGALPNGSSVRSIPSRWRDYGAIGHVTVQYLTDFDGCGFGKYVTSHTSVGSGSNPCGPVMRSHFLIRRFQCAVLDTRACACAGRTINAPSKTVCSTEKLALSWRANGNEPTVISITLMAAHPDYIGKSVQVRLGPGPPCGLENRRPKGYPGSSPVPSAISDQQLTVLP